MTHLTALLTAAVALALAAGACGGDDGPSAEEFRAEVAGLCDHPEPIANRAPNLDDDPAVFAQWAADVREGAAGIDALEAPDEEAERAARLVREMELSADGADAVADAIEGRDDVALARAIEDIAIVLRQFRTTCIAIEAEG